MHRPGFLYFFLIFLLAIHLGACLPSPAPVVTPSPPADTPSPPATVTPESSLTPTVGITLSSPPTPSPTSKPRTLTICMGAEPDTLYIYAGAMHAMHNVLAAIYDGPIDSNGFGYQPVILEKLPNLADGDALLQTVTVRAGDWIVDANEIVQQLADGVRYLPAGCRTSACAQSYTGGEVEMEALSARFTLLEGLKWADGQPLTSEDSVFSYAVAREECSFPLETGTRSCGFLGSGDALEKTGSYTALDERTVEWAGYPGFLDQTYFTNFAHPLPAHQLRGREPQELIESPDTSQTPLGWGPYLITEWEPGQYIRLARNRQYFRAGDGLPRFDNLIFRMVGGEDRNVTDLLAGECDLLDLEASIYLDYQELLDLEGAGSLQAHFTTGTVWEHADFGILPGSYDDGYQTGLDRPDFFGDVRTRQAIAMCMDRQAVVNDAFFGQSEVLHTYLPASHPLFNPAAPRYPFDPLAASALLESVGWIDHDSDPNTPRVANNVSGVPDGTALSFRYWTTTSEQRQRVAGIFKDSLALCGVEVNPEFWELVDFFAEGPGGPIFGRQFDMAQFAWLTGVTPPCDLFLSANIPGPPDAVDAAGSPRFPGGWGETGGPLTNNTGFANQEYDQACQTALSLLPGERGYTEAHQAAQEIFARNLPAVPLFSRLWVTIARHDFCGHVMDPTAESDFWNIEEYDFGPGCP